MSEFLRNVPLFADLSDADLDHLCELAKEIRLAPEERLFEEGARGDAAYVIEHGELEILKKDGEREVLLAIRGRGDVIGEMSLLEDAPRMAAARARGDATVLALGADEFEDVLTSSSSAARSMLHTVVARWRGTEARLRQSEKMAQLGTLAAGLAHELNNPAAAVQRGAASLIELDERAQRAERELLKDGVDDAQRDALDTLDAKARAAAGKPDTMDSMARSDLEAELEDLLDDKDVEDGWELAPQLVQAGLRSDDVEAVFDSWAGRAPAVLKWLGLVFARAAVVAEVHQGAARISELVKSLKMYAHLDQAPVQEIDVREGLDNTLVLLRSKLKGGVEVVREYADELPKIHAFGSELNQVWTNLMDNAIDAMDCKGRLIVRARVAGDCVEVDIEDDGPGIPEDIQGRIFDAFFTTKAPGKGTGLGLDICYNIVANKHKGALNLTSRPGHTCFTARLPIDFTKGGALEQLAVKRPDDSVLKAVFESSTSIAVVGASLREGRPAFSVPRYLAKQGFEITAVNPTIDGDAFGRPAVSSLADLPAPPDVVLVFRKPDAVPAIADEAIRIGAKALWLQEGIVHDGAGKKALDAGLQVVMDMCMLKTHARLFGD